MNALTIIIQLVVASILVFFISGRLIGSQVNLGKRIISVIISVIFTSFIFWYTYLRGTSFFDEGIISNLMNVVTLLWFGGMLLISMLLYLFFELFDQIEINENGIPVGRRSSLKTLLIYWRRQKRLSEVVRIAMKNGVTRTVKYARSREDERELAIALRDTLEQCGGIFVKFGQVLSTRKELLSPVFIEELEKLQQHVRPLSKEQVDEILKKNLKGDVNQIFSYFSEEPLASASIGQVHKAILRDSNEPVAVKLLRPDVKNIMNEDLGILMEFASWISSKSQWAETLGFLELAKGFSIALSEESDFTIEARNMEQMTTIIQSGKNEVKVPKVYYGYSNANILVMEFVKGKSVAIAQPIYEEHHIDRRQFAQSLLFSFLEQVLVSGIFHADPHPGNIYIEQHTGKLTMLDFGAVGRLADPQQEGLKYFLIGIYQNDAPLVVDGVSLLVENTED
ncbi:MAG: AarF/UbiB family protein, partial [Solibacillus sp.]